MRKERAIQAGWIHEGESPLFERLAYPRAVDHPECVFNENRPARDELLELLLSGKIQPMPNPPMLGVENDRDILIAQVDRYGLPIRTVLSSHTGLMRSDPYYPPSFLRDFYYNHYRQLYRGKKHSSPQFLADQITHGQRILQRTGDYLPQRRLKILDIGCGMGGTLIAFHWLGHQTFGCDYGEDYGRKGRMLGLDIRIGGLEAVLSEAPFDLIICSHVLEHSTDPIGFARSAAGMLAGDGMMYIEVPGIFYIEKFWSADVLRYLQNAHAWHFTANTLTATLSHAGLGIVQADESIWCVARPDQSLAPLRASDGPRVLNELNRLESELTRSRIAA